MVKETLTTEEKRLRRIDQLKAKLQKEEAKLRKDERKKRNGQLIAFGIYTEELFKRLNSEEKVRMTENIKKLLSGRNLERALDGLKRLKG